MFVQSTQLDAAQAIHDVCPEWRRSEQALDGLAQAMPGHDISAVLIKTVAVDALYATRVRVIDRQPVALHVQRILADADLERAGVELVEQMADVPLAHHYKSFASKFGHFFVSRRFPILDSYAVVALREHLDPGALRADPSYTDFAQAFSRFAQGNSDTRRLDWYLWIVGQWLRRGAASVNAELARVFDANPPELAQLIA